jgi:SAM-dependent methyltransferase
MAKNVTARIRNRQIVSRLHAGDEHAIAAAYNQAGDKYEAYADGDLQDPNSFQGQYAYGDRRIWAVLDDKLRTLCSKGARSIRILDLGCGPGTWLCRLVTRAWALGFTSITARGIDIADEQVRRAQTRSRNLAALGGVSLDFEIGDICTRLPEADESIDLCVCLYGVLNHIPRDRLPRVLAEVARVTCGDFVTAVRAVGSTPTIFVDAVEEARWFWYDRRASRLEAELQNGRRISFDFRLFGAAELKALAAAYFELKDLRGLDLFHGRFAGDRRWNPPSSVVSAQFAGELERLEELYCRDAEFVDHATHLLLEAAPRKRGAAVDNPKMTCVNSTLRLRLSDRCAHAASASPPEARDVNRQP